SHDSLIKDESIDKDPDPGKLGRGDYVGHTKDRLGRNSSGPIKSNANVRPRDKKGSGGSEGFFLDVADDHRKSRKPGNNGPMYFEAKDRHYITYWFFFAFNDGPASHPDAFDDHEGDWERICIRLDSNNRATEVAFYQHDGHKKMKWQDVEKSGTHPVVYSAKGSHATYDSEGPKDIHFKGRKVPVVHDTANKGSMWIAQSNPAQGQPGLVNVRDQAWYGYGGAWGTVGAKGENTGPQGPSKWKGPAPEEWE